MRKMRTFYNTVGLINCLRQPGQLRYQLPKSMVLNLSRLIKFSGTETYPAAKTESIGLPAYAHLSQVFAEPLRQLYRDPELRAVNRDSSIYRDYPIWQLYRDPKPRAVNQDYPIWQLCLDAEIFSHLPGLLSGPKAPSRLPGLCKNSCQRVPRTATQLNRRAVSTNISECDN
jgi:hypothetical protein